jgi:hypothetical protein
MLTSATSTPGGRFAFDIRAQWIQSIHRLQGVTQEKKELDYELAIAEATEKHPGMTPRISRDNGPQFIADDFKAFVRDYWPVPCSNHLVLST